MASVIPPQSPRRALTSLTTNITLTPQRLSTGKLNRSQSPIKPGTPLTPASVLSTRKSIVPAIPTLNASKKRPIGKVLAAERDETHTSFSSLINYDTSSDGAEMNSQSQPDSSAATIVAEMPRVDPNTQRVQAMKAKLQMAMFRIATNQLTTPFAELVVPERESETPSTPPRKSVEEEDDPPSMHVETPITARKSVQGAQKRVRISDDLTSSAVKGSAAEGLLGLNRAC